MVTILYVIFLHKLSNVKANDNSLLISLDVDSLYTNIDNEMGLRAVAEVFEQKPLPIHKYILQLLRLSLEGNDFTFDGNSYLQVSGTAMGKRFAPNYANLTMAYWEEKNLPKCDKQPSIYLRYLDDIFLIWDHSVEDFDKFFHTLNTAHPNITLKSNVQKKQLEFLDVLVYKGHRFQAEGLFDTKVYFKPTDSHALLHKKSYHPKHTFGGIIKSQLIRFGRICNQQAGFEEATSTLFTALKSRGYTARFLRQIKDGVKFQYFPPSQIRGMRACDSARCSICPHVL